MQKPIHEIKVGRVRVSIWVRENGDNEFYSVSISRLYKTLEGWKSTTNLDLDDVLMAAKALDVADTWMRTNAGLLHRDMTESKEETVIESCEDLIQ
jgi:hypothetical protein